MKIIWTNNENIIIGADNSCIIPEIIIENDLIEEGWVENNFKLLIRINDVYGIKESSLNGTIKNGNVTFSKSDISKNELLYEVNIEVNQNSVVNDYLKIEAIDNNGTYLSTISTKQIKIDGKSPDIKIYNEDIVNDWGKRIYIPFIVEDLESGVADIKCKYDKNTDIQIKQDMTKPNSYVAIVEILPNFNQEIFDYFTVIATDNKQNEAIVQSQRKIGLDNKSPEIEIIDYNLQNIWYKQSKSMLLKVTDLGSGVQNISAQLTDNSLGIIKIQDYYIDNEKQEDMYLVTISAFEGKDICEQITFHAYDHVGNHAQKATKENTKIDHTIPKIEIDETTIQDDYVKDKLKIKFTVKDSIMGSRISQEEKFKFKISNADVKCKKLKRIENVNEYEAEINAKKNIVINEPIEICVYDEAGNYEKKTTSSYIKIDNEKVSLTELKVENISEKENNAIICGEKLRISFLLTDHDGSGINQEKIKISVNKKIKIHPVKIEQNRYFFEYEMGKDIEGKENTNIKIDQIYLEDMAGNHSTEYENYSTEIVFYEPIEKGLSNIQFLSNNNNPKYVKNEDIIQVSFYTTHPVDISKDYIIMSTSCEIEWINKNKWLADIGKYYHEGQYVIKNDTEYDNMSVRFSMCLSDKTNNLPVKITESTMITYFAPIIVDENELINISNSSVMYAKDGDTLNLKIGTRHPVYISDCIIGNTKMKMSSNDSTEFSGTMEIKNGDFNDNSLIKYSVNITDDAGNEELIVVNKENNITYYAPIEMKKLEVYSNNQCNKKYVKNKDELRMTFKTNHPCSAKYIYINDRAIPILTDDFINFYVNISVEESYFQDNEKICYEFQIEDDANNNPVVCNQFDAVTEEITYLGPIILKDVSLCTTNEKNGSMYAKDNDIIKLMFSTNHSVTIDNMNLFDENEEIHSNANNQNFEVIAQISENKHKDIQQILFQGTIMDAAGNKSDELNETSVSNRIFYYAPIKETTKMTIVADASDYLKNGDYITIKSDYNHEVYIQDFSIMKRKIETNQNGTHIELNYQIPINEKELSEGMICFSFRAEDVAGNKKIIKNSEKQNIIYDRTKPTIQIMPNINSFINHEASIKVMYRDEHLSSEDIYLSINGIEQNQDLEQIDKKYINKENEINREIILSHDDNYEIIAKCRDKAHNWSEEEKMCFTIDTTNPQIKEVGIQFNKPNIFKSGLILSNYLNIEEENIGEVMCTVTDQIGTYEWNIEKALTEEGKKTISIMIRDMAGNTSTRITFDIFIDSTPPLPIVEEITTGTTLSEGESNKYTFSKKDTKFRISLKDIPVCSYSMPDQFEILKITNLNNDSTVNLLEGMKVDFNSENQVYEFQPEMFSDYIIEIRAIDEVGNGTKQQKYYFSYKEEIDNSQNSYADKQNKKNKQEKLKKWIIPIGILTFSIFIGIFLFTYFHNRNRILM